MRSIKFRYVYKDLDGGIVIYHFPLKNIEAWDVWGTRESRRSHGYELLSIDQFTWLLDKNGKEIYEGDILNYCNKQPYYIVRYGSYNRNSGYKNLAPQYIGASFYLEVVNQKLLREDLPIYSHNDCAFLYPVTPTFSDFEKYKKNWGLEVIGNIHEHPELLNQ